MGLLAETMAMMLLYLALVLLYAWPLRRRPRPRLRLAVCAAAFLAAGYAYWAVGMAAARLLWWQPAMLFGLVAGALALLCDQPVLGSLYSAAWMVMTQQFFMLLFNAWYTWMDAHGGGAPLPWLWAVPFTAACTALAYRFAVQGMAVGGQFRMGPRQTLSALMLLVVFEFLAASIMEDFHTVSLGGNWPVILMCLFYCLTVLYLQNALFKKSAIQHDLDALDLLWHRQKEQYDLARRNVALINRRCHDLKVQLYALRDMPDGAERRRYLDELDDSIAIYDAIVKTGSEVLDTILTEKSLDCREHGIHIQCIADGSRMGFLDPMDVYVVFGNALDNAIEAVGRFADKDKRQIDVLIHVKQQFLIINVTNPLDVPLRFRDGLPVTTKPGRYHGFGLKTIQRTVKKYDGNLTVSTEGGCFSLKILIPLPA